MTPWIQFKGASFLSEACTHRRRPLSQKVTWEKLGTLVFFFFVPPLPPSLPLLCFPLSPEHDPVSQHLLGPGCRVHCGAPRGGASQRVNPTNCGCVFKMWCSAGGEAGPIQVHAPVWKRGERLRGPRCGEWNNPPARLLKGHCSFVSAEANLKGDVIMVQLGWYLGAQWTWLLPTKQLKAPLFPLLAWMFGYMRTLLNENELL